MRYISMSLEDLEQIISNALYYGATVGAEHMSSEDEDKDFAEYVKSELKDLRINYEDN